MKVRLSSYKTLINSVLIIYVSYLFSPYFHYVAGKGVYLWHLTVIFFTPVLIFNFYKYSKVNYANLIFSLYFILLILFQFITSSEKLDFSIRVIQLFLSMNIFFIFYNLSIKRCKDSYNYINKVYIKLTKIIILFTFIQFFIRLFTPELALSEFQNYRHIALGIKQSSSFFYEPRGLAQFLSITLFCYLFFNLKLPKKWLIALLLALLLSFSLGGIIVSVITFGVYVLLNKGFLKKLKYISISLFITIFIGSFIDNNPFSTRLISLVDKVDGIQISVILENAYKLNHKEFYQQYSDEFEKDYGFGGGSESVSILSEASYLYHIYKHSPFVGMNIVDQNRYVSLNALVDFIARLGFIGLLLFLLSTRKVFIHESTLQIIIFLIFFFAIDGALSKPQLWFLFGVLYFYCTKNKYKL